MHSHIRYYTKYTLPRRNTHIHDKLRLPKLNKEWKRNINYYSHSYCLSNTALRMRIGTRKWKGFLPEPAPSDQYSTVLRSTRFVTRKHVSVLLCHSRKNKPPYSCHYFWKQFSWIYHNDTSLVLSTCPLHTNSGCGEERRLLIGPW